MSPRTAENIIISAFLALLLTTCVAGAAAAHYREAAKQARTLGCDRVKPHEGNKAVLTLPLKKRITA